MSPTGMPGYGPASYGDGLADVYDEWYADDRATDATVAFLDDLARSAVGGTVGASDHGTGVDDDASPRAHILELAVGTGRLAVPLSRHHVVTGLDASPAMLARLAARDGGHTVSAVLGDMGRAADWPAGPFDLVFVADNSLFMLTEDGGQADCFRAVSGALAPHGVFVVEAFVPHDTAPPGSAVQLRSMNADRVVLTVSITDPDRQQIDGQFVDLVDGQSVRLRPWRIRYATPEQLDDLAEAAGLQLVGRFADVSRSRFDDTSERHISVYAHR